MESLYKLYSNNYFGIGLFIVVTILAFSFLIILFFGKKDEKTREAKKEDNELLDNVKNDEESLNSMTLSNNVDNKENLTMEEKPADSTLETVMLDQESSKEIDPFDASNVVLEDKNEEVAQEPNSALDDISVIENNIEKTTNPFMMETAAPVIQEEEVPNIFTEEPKEVSEDLPKVKNTFSNQFSSVYVNRENEVKETEEKSEPVIKPVKPSFELPKTLDLPKLNKEENTNDNIIQSVSNTSSDIDDIINSLQDESFTIEKE